ncbi:hypothetical protein JTT01_07940 [Clostridium botulinum]|nr:hypothetical protein [Clostridium botulinum]MCS4516824.1 hypothetical protein [Clostridium botulinum]
MREKRNWSYEGSRCLCRRYKKIFIGEATAIGFSGGVVGLLIGSFISFVINTMLKSKLSTSSSGDVK